MAPTLVLEFDYTAHARHRWEDKCSEPDPVHQPHDAWKAAGLYACGRGHGAGPHRLHSWPARDRQRGQTQQRFPAASGANVREPEKRACRRRGHFQHVVKLNNYFVDMKYLPIFRQVRDSYLSDQNRPASTTVAISGLAREGALLEVEAIAVLPAAEQTSPIRKEVARPGRSNRAPKRTSG